MNSCIKDINPDILIDSSMGFTKGLMETIHKIPNIHKDNETIRVEHDDEIFNNDPVSDYNDSDDKSQK